MTLHFSLCLMRTGSALTQSNVRFSIYRGDLCLSRGRSARAARRVVGGQVTCDKWCELDHVVCRVRLIHSKYLDRYPRHSLINIYWNR